ncbi:YggT family protein [Effusibacillus dendaii]|uniref:Membrane protein n=1 Tax=Effusibacillus dendaii TaxID=2743772 RepID=A0A7I8D7R4_9BACL|nr:YggT family protein [Effusibacillus dendaii]BCJ86057.1 membrane protein [Effusibacillus dendaii]
MYQLTHIISYLFEIYSFLVIARVLMSWVPDMERTGFGQWLVRLTEPYLAIFRRFIPPFGMIDISPIVALLALQLIERGLMTVLGSFF